MALHGGLNAGATIIMHEKFDPVRSWETIEKERCTMFMAVPTIYYRLLNTWNGKPAALAQMAGHLNPPAAGGDDIFGQGKAQAKALPLKAGERPSVRISGRKPAHGFFTFPLDRRSKRRYYFNH